MPVSSIDGRGLDELWASLSELRDRIAATRIGCAGTGRSVAAPVRLAIDRAFVIKGRGTVVTGIAARRTAGPGATSCAWYQVTVTSGLARCRSTAPRSMQSRTAAGLP